MKKLIVTAIAVASAASVFAQGTIAFNNGLGSVKFRVYAPAATATGLSQMGASSFDTPTGTTSWAGFNLIGTTLAGQYGGQQTFAQLLVAAGTGANESALQPAVGGGVTTFRTSTAIGSAGPAGLVVNSTPTFANITDANYAAGETVEMVVWDHSLNGTGPLNGFDLSVWGSIGSKNAEDAWKAGLIAAGTSGLISDTAQFGGFGGPPPGTPPGMPAGMTSFNLYIVPEPSTFALAGLGAAALLIFRRRK